MNKKTKTLELTGKKTEELKKMLLDAKNALFSLRLEHAQQKLKDTSQLFHKRKGIAQILTKLKEMELIKNHE